MTFDQYKSRLIEINPLMGSDQVQMRLSTTEFWRLQHRAFETGVVHAAEQFKFLRELERASGVAAQPPNFDDIFGRFVQG